MTHPRSDDLVTDEAVKAAAAVMVTRGSVRQILEAALPYLRAEILHRLDCVATGMRLPLIRSDQSRGGSMSLRTPDDATAKAGAVGTPCARCGGVMFYSKGGGQADLGGVDLAELVAEARSRGDDVSRRHVSRHLCTVCYPAAHRDGTLNRYPRVQRDRDEIMRHYADLRAELGPAATLAAIADRMDLPRTTLSQTLARAARDGDPRSDYTGKRGPRPLRKEGTDDDTTA